MTIIFHVQCSRFLSLESESIFFAFTTTMITSVCQVSLLLFVLVLDHKCRTLTNLASAHGLNWLLVLRLHMQQSVELSWNSHSRKITMECGPGRYEMTQYCTLSNAMSIQLLKMEAECMAFVCHCYFVATLSKSER